MTAKTQFIEANGISFGYRVVGEPHTTEPPVLLLNHFRSSIDLWDPLIVNGIAASGRRVIPYDYAGVGQSSGEVRLSIKEFSADVVAFLTALLPTLHGSPTQVDILSFSMGGYVAQQVVLDSPDLVRKLIISGSGPSGSTGTLPGLFSRPMPEVQSAITTNPPQAQPILDSFFPTFIDTKDASNAWIGRIMSARAAVAGKDGEPEFKSFLAGPPLNRLTEAYLKWDADPVPSSLLQTVQKDVLVTAGDSDLIVPTINSFSLAKQLPRANFVMYPGSGHGHIFQYADFYVKQVNEFLKGEWPVPSWSYGTIRPQLGI
ncbi:Alpha/Beta hydrolase protein [Coniochaeta sp. 2T2.1]|nr:Alpha/Beta hydrolase protein [Coniochaeta sp. 2T2.1]